ncbi:MaoC family dehydratase N-terminal domain-containing protein [Oceanicoccus sp. KOV_DT_Chl]|uniref:FAS1-like dehydratase domain-containing protein n=1 Tax=Oceanicoccus sp. KOV_DT_Chl TaxID=1904639 RepID=UPI000C7C7D3F|nr:MaoC family dehydratase N-terminal domain-containing protein [Oceanicoccus sp. KOV_DT_Chl]
MLEQAELEQRLNACIGIVVGPLRSWDPVNMPMIRHWCDAMGDLNPLYTDPEFATQGPYGEIIAPPSMIQAWTMTGYTRRLAPGSKGLPEGADNHFDLLTDGGYLSVVAVNCDQHYLQPLKLGDQIYQTTQLESVSEKKQTALGEGYFTSELFTYYNQHDEKVVDMHWRLLRFKP